MKKRNELEAALEALVVSFSVLLVGAILVLVGTILVSLVAPILPANAEEVKTEVIKTEMEERLEILEKVEGLLRLDHYEEKEDKHSVHYWYDVIRSRYWDGIVEMVIVELEVYKTGEIQTYWIEGRREEVLKVTWRKAWRGNGAYYEVETICWVKRKLEFKEGKFIKTGELEIVPWLTEERAKKLFKKAHQHYLEVRKFFGVDTIEGLEKVIEEELLGTSEFK